jgi:uncharacterized membrane protein
MSASNFYIILSIVVLAIVAGLAIFVHKKGKGLTPLAGLAFAFIIAGIVFGDDRLIGYSLMGTGIILATIDIIKKSKPEV